MFRQTTTAALSTMLMAGCVNSYSPYGPYQGMPPGTYGQPQPYPTGPGTIYAPPTSVMPGGPMPDTLNSAPSWGTGSPSAPIPGAAPGSAYDPSSSPTFKNNSSTSPGSGVPNYKDPSFNNDGFEASVAPGVSGTSYTQAPTNVVPSGYQPVPTYTGSSGDEQFLRPLATPADGSPQLQSVPQSTAPASQPAAPLFPSEQPWGTSSKSSPTATHHYAYDGHYHWLQGRVQFDDQLQRWQIQYSTSPSATDPYGGRITLSQHNELIKCRPGDVIIVRGEVVEDTHDDAGKPVYKVNQIARVTTQS